MFITFGLMSEGIVKDQFDYDEESGDQSQIPPGSFATHPPHEKVKSSEHTKAGSIKIEQGYVIPLPLCNLSNRRVLELKECYIVLFEHFLTYKIVGKYEVLDDTTEMWEEHKCNFRWTRVRKDIVDVSMSFDNQERLYVVEIEFIKNTQSWCWEKGKDAKNFYSIMQNYLVTRDQKFEDEDEKEV